MLAHPSLPFPTLPMPNFPQLCVDQAVDEPQDMKEIMNISEADLQPALLPFLGTVTAVQGWEEDLGQPGLGLTHRKILNFTCPVWYLKSLCDEHSFSPGSSSLQQSPKLPEPGLTQPGSSPSSKTAPAKAVQTWGLPWNHRIN